MITLATHVHIRWMIQRDLDEVLAIENESYQRPWIKEDFLICLRQRNCIGMVAENCNEVIGYALYELHPYRLQLLNIAVDPYYTRQGVGKKIIHKLIDKLSSHRRGKITLDVRESNLAAQCFFRSLGFIAFSVVRKYYENTGEDAYCMAYNLPKSARRP